MYLYLLSPHIFYLSNQICLIWDLPSHHITTNTAVIMTSPLSPTSSYVTAVPNGHYFQYRTSATTPRLEPSGKRYRKIPMEVHGGWAKPPCPKKERTCHDYPRCPIYPYGPEIFPGNDYVIVYMNFMSHFVDVGIPRYWERAIDGNKREIGVRYARKVIFIPYQISTKLFWKNIILCYSLTLLKDALRPNLNYIIAYLELLVPLLRWSDKKLESFIAQSQVQPFFALSWVLTWFSHNLDVCYLSLGCAIVWHTKIALCRRSILLQGYLMCF